MSDIQYVYPLIHNKVTSPHYVTPTLRRARLVDWLNQASECRAVVIAADAGYGKTTLLWQWEREVAFPCYWYKLDRNDRDWSLHISYLIEAISQRHAGFGRRAHSMLQQLGGPGSSRPGVAAYLLAEMYERLTVPCTFIIDDWQFVASVTEVRGLWNQILRDAPPTCRFIFLSRAKPQLQFARFKTHGGYAEMRTDALRFTDREIEELFRDIYNDPLDPAELVELERRTEGWAASLQLVEVSLRERRTPEDRRAFINSITATRDSDLVEFLAEEVLDQQPETIRNFLLSTSVLHQITPELAAMLSGVRDGSEILTNLESRGIFTFRLDAKEDLYRYHGLFRDFLERRLIQERSEGEVMALHIHAASYYETHESWPESIHHYLCARLQPQAARLIAKYGEGLTTAGRLPLLDEWLGQLSPRSVRENARLSLLAGEVNGVKGNWSEALDALQRARGFFARKGDTRQEALACSKLSTVYNNMGDVARCAEMAQVGLNLAPEDAHATRIRLRGNVATTTTWLASMARAEHECKRLAVESTTRGYEQYAAIAHHNLGVMLRDAGRLDESVACLEKAARFWDASPSNPFADNAELVQTLLLLGQSARAWSIAQAAQERTRPWPKPFGEARYGRALVLAYTGDFAAATTVLRDLLSDSQEVLGPVGEKALSLLIECLYLSDGGADEMKVLLARLDADQTDPRLAPTTSVARALAAHRIGQCDGDCDKALETLQRWDDNGATLAGLIGRVPLALLCLEHGKRGARRRLIRVAREAVKSSARGHFRWWLRRFVPHVGSILGAAGGASVVAELVEMDPPAWIHAAAPLLPSLQVNERKLLISAIEANADQGAVGALRGIDGSDVQELRRHLTQRFATRVFVRSFGSLAIHRSDWDTAPILVGRKRVRLLLGLLVANRESGLTRDEVIDAMWPDSDPVSAVNSLNQTVFQLRRLIEPTYREGDSPQYIISTVELVQLNPMLVHTDLEEARSIVRTMAGQHDLPSRVALADGLVALVRGEFLADLKYEDWVSSIQLTVHAELRNALLQVAEGGGLPVGHESILKAGSALTRLDPYDETAHLAIAKHLAGSGRRSQAREFIARFAARLRRDLEEEPSEELRVAAALVGADL